MDPVCFDVEVLVWNVVVEANLRLMCMTIRLFVVTSWSMFWFLCDRCSAMRASTDQTWALLSKLTLEERRITHKCCAYRELHERLL